MGWLRLPVGGDESCCCCGGGEGEGGDGEDGEVHALGLVELGLDVADAEPGYGDADGCETDRGLEHGSAHDHGDDGAAVCAEGHADADLGGAAGYGVGGYAVEAEGGEQERQDAEERHELSDHAVLGKAVGDLFVEGLELHDGEIWIDRGKCLAGERLHVVHGAGGLDDEGAGVESSSVSMGPFLLAGRWRIGTKVHLVVRPAYVV